MLVPVCLHVHGQPHSGLAKNQQHSLLPPLFALLSTHPRQLFSKMLWVDRYRPTSLDKLDYHKDQAGQLRELAKSGELPHLLLYGPSGAGKKTRVMALLREVFGPGVEKVKLEHRGFKTPTGRAVELTTSEWGRSPSPTRAF